MAKQFDFPVVVVIVEDGMVTRVCTNTNPPIDVLTVDLDNQRADFEMIYSLDNLPKEAAKLVKSMED